VQSPCCYDVFIRRYLSSMPVQTPMQRLRRAINNLLRGIRVLLFLPVPHKIKRYNCNDLDFFAKSLYLNRTQKKSLKAFEVNALRAHDCLRSASQGMPSTCNQIIASSSVKILTGGCSNLYTALLRIDESEYFLKVVSRAKDTENLFYNLMLNDKICRKGQRFSFRDLVGSFEVGPVRGYVFPSIRWRRFNYSSMEDILYVVSGIAEMNISNLYSKHAARVLGKKKFTIPSPVISNNKQAFLNSSFIDNQIAFMRHSKIAKKWDSVIKYIDSLRWGLCSNDANLGNICRVSNAVTFVDMGQACVGALGADLFWIVRQAKGCNVAIIVEEYCKVARGFGVHVSAEEILLACYAAYAIKWMKTSVRSPSTRSFKSYLSALSAAEKCILLCNSASS
jgi:hypothetical protein